MMSPLETDTSPEIAELSRWLAASGYAGVTPRLSGRELLLDGFVPEFVAKREVEARARMLTGFSVRNFLRVTPC